MKWGSWVEIVRPRDESRDQLDSEALRDVCSSGPSVSENGPQEIAANLADWGQRVAICARHTPEEMTHE